MMATTDHVSREAKARTAIALVRRAAAVAGIAAPVVFVLAVLFGGAGMAGFSQTSSFISELGETGASTAPFVNTAFTVVGVLMFVFAVGVGLSVPGMSKVGALLLVPAASFVAMAVWPCSSGCPIAIVNVNATANDALHNAAAIAGLVSIALAALMLGELAPDGFGSKGFASFSGAAGATVGVLSAVFGMAVLSGSGIAIGLSERVLVLAALVWVEVTAVALLHWRTEPAS